MERPVAADIDLMTASTQSLQRTIEKLHDDDVQEPSLLPGWTRGHVLTHLARNADGMVNLVTWARTGVETHMYESRERRDSDIEAGAGRSAGALREDVEASAERLSAAFATIEPDQWETLVRVGMSRREIPARTVPAVRRSEVEIHHVDLDLDYTLAHLPEDFVERMLTETVAELSARPDAPGFDLVGNDNEGSWTVGAGGQQITGPPPSLLGWLLGRTDGIGLFSDQPLPALGRWR